MALKYILRKLYRGLCTQFIYLSINIGTGLVNMVMNLWDPHTFEVGDID